MDFAQNMIDTTDATGGSPTCPASPMPRVLNFQDALAFVERSYPIPTARILKTALRQIGRALVTVRARATGEYLDPNPKNLDLARLPFDLPAINQSADRRCAIAWRGSTATSHSAMPCRACGGSAAIWGWWCLTVRRNCRRPVPRRPSCQWRTPSRRRRHAGSPPG